MEQDVTVVVSRPLPQVFARLEDPSRVMRWLTPRASHEPVPEIEVIGHEPPRLVAFRVTTTEASHVLRITCAAQQSGATRVHVHQSGAERLGIDLPALDRLLRDGPPEGVE